MIEIAIGIGMVLSLIFTETLGITAGGIIVPGYIALYMDQPIKVLTTFLISIIVFFLDRAVKGYQVLAAIVVAGGYSRGFRIVIIVIRTVVTILIITINSKQNLGKD